MKQYMDILRKHFRLVTGMIGLVYLVGVFGLSFDTSRPLFEKAVPFTLLISLFFLAVFHEGYSLKFIALALFIFLASLIIEIAGVATGQIFGYYDYGPTLGVKVMQTPLLIGINWLTLVYMVWVLLSEMNLPVWLRCLLGPAIMVLYDYFLEPVAIRTDMWTWGGEVPLKNYLAWAIISLLFFILVALVHPRIRNRLATPLFIIQLAFFILLNLVMK